jgi:TolA-binding protein
MIKRKIYLHLFFTLFVMVMVANCAAKKVPETPPPAPVKKQHPARVQPKPVDPQAQQRYYDLGLTYYADEDYPKAQKAFQQAIEYGPDSSLGIKARENLMKTEQILKTLRELERQ